MLNLRMTSFLPAVACWCMVSACSVGPDYIRPTAETPPEFKEMNGWKMAEPRDEAIKGPWWELFNDSQLNALELRMNISNQNVAVAEAQFREARALVQAAKAGYFPTLTAGASATRSMTSGTLGSTTRSGGTFNDFRLSADLSWELDIWGKVRRQVEAGRASAQASAADLQGVRLSMQAELAQNYFQLRTLDAQIHLLDSTVEAYSKFLKLTQNRYKSGVASRADVLQAETQLKTTQAQAIDVGVQRSQLEHAIAVLIGRPPALFSIPSMPLDASPPLIPVAVPSKLLERRPDIAAAERRVAAANAQIGVAKAAYFPTVTLSGDAGFESSKFSKWLTWPSRLWSLGPAVSETLFDGGLRGAQMDQARATWEASVATYRQTVLTGFQEVEDNLAALRILEDEAKVQGEALLAARQSVILTTNQYKAGIASALDVIVTQTTELGNERTTVSILGTRMTDSVLLIKALGGGWDAAALPTNNDLGKRGEK